jgi:hypothetical protein
MKFNKYHKIPQFKDVIRTIGFKATYQGEDEDGEPIYDGGAPKPVLTFKGTVKLHGTNAGVTYTPEKGVMAGKKKAATEVINGKKVVTNDGFLGVDALAGHYEFNRFVQVTEKEYLTDLMNHLWKEYCVEGQQLTLFGEWAGSGVQKGVGISNIPKSFFVFGCKVRTIATEKDTWINIDEWDFTPTNMHNINHFQTYSLEIDFNSPALIQHKLVEITEAVEKDCPVSRQLLGPSFKKTLVGEGVVWTAFWKDEKFIFKVKGEKHSTSNVKTLASVDPEVVKSIFEFVDYACTENRINQGIQEVNATEKSHMPDLLRWVANDIITEENDVLESNGLEWKQVASECSNKVRQFYFKELDKI